MSLTVPLRIFPRPFFDKVTLDLPNAPQPLVITSAGAPTKPYIHSVTNGRALGTPPPTWIVILLFVVLRRVHLRDADALPS